MKLLRFKQYENALPATSAPVTGMAPVAVAQPGAVPGETGTTGDLSMFPVATNKAYPTVIKFENPTPKYDTTSYRSRKKLSQTNELNSADLNYSRHANCLSFDDVSLSKADDVQNNTVYKKNK